jgi:hypothetical protein
MMLSQLVHCRRNSCILTAVPWVRFTHVAAVFEQSLSDFEERPAPGPVVAAGRARAWGTEMPINRLLANSELEPDAIENLNLAFKQALRSLHLVDRDDPVTEIVARKIIEIAATGVHDAAEIAEITVKQLGIQ